MKLSIAIILSLLFSALTHGQDLTQTVRGRVIDYDSQISIPGANVAIVDSDPFMGASSDVNGYFKIENVPVGRYDIQITYLGFETKMLYNIQVGAGKEVVLNIELVESLIEMEEVEITAEKDKASASNEMATVSARSFSVEETKRYAASINDPARMALSFAGVTGGDDGQNQIIIRGNSPRGLLWRAEGIEIPNPNHFSDDGASGGGVSILSSQMMANSDFYTGAFPAEYGNAASGVFDIKLRQGNSQKREYTFQAGFLGIDAALEGPFKKGGTGSYLANYRFSSLFLLNGIGIDIVGDALPVFQDLSFKLFQPTKKAGVFSMFGIGGKSNITLEAFNPRNLDNTEEDFISDRGVIGISHHMPLDERSYLRTTLASSATKVSFDVDRTDTLGNISHDYEETFIERAERLSILYNRKFNAKHTVKAGFIGSLLTYDLQSFWWDADNLEQVALLSENGNTFSSQGYISWKYRITKDLSFNSGLHGLVLHLNNNAAIEPRAGLKWNFAQGQSLNAGFGIHSRIESLNIYLADNTDDNGDSYKPNEDLGFQKAYHYILGYDYMITNNLHFKTEVYYQDLTNVPIVADTTSVFSAVNFSQGYTNTPLVNEGTGVNYGIEVTLERFYADGYYYTFTGSLFDSEYVGGDGVTRNTAFNSTWASTVLAGKEWQFDEKMRLFGFGLKLLTRGGQPVIPIDLEASIAAGQEVRDTERAYEERVGDYIRGDIQINYRRYKNKTTREIRLDIQNFTNHRNPFSIRYDRNTEQIVTTTMLGLIPVLSYKIEF